MHSARRSAQGLGLALAAALLAGRAEAAPVSHSVYAQVAAAQRNDNWAHLQATCSVTVYVHDNGGMGHQRIATFSFPLDAAGLGQSRMQFVDADKRCHRGSIGAVSAGDVQCTMTGGHQKTPQIYAEPQLNGSVLAHRPSPAARFDGRYFSATVASTETSCEVPTGGKDPLPPVPPEEPQGDSWPPPPPPPPKPDRTPTFSGRHVNPPVCFPSEMSRGSFISDLAVKKRHQQALLAATRDPQARANIEGVIGDMDTTTEQAEKRPLCPEEKVPVTRADPKTHPLPLDKERPAKTSWLAQALSHVSLGVGVSGGGDRRREGGRSTEKPTPAEPPAPRD